MCINTMEYYGSIYKNKLNLYELRWIIIHSIFLCGGRKSMLLNSIFGKTPCVINVYITGKIKRDIYRESLLYINDA